MGGLKLSIRYSFLDEPLTVNDFFNLNGQPLCTKSSIDRAAKRIFLWIRMVFVTNVVPVHRPTNVTYRSYPSFSLLNRILLPMFLVVFLSSTLRLREFRNIKNYVGPSIDLSVDPAQDEPVAEIMYRGGPSNVSTADHPHAGARDADGYWNYVPDITYLRRKVLYELGAKDPFLHFPLEPEFWEEVCEVAPGHGVEGWEGYELLRLVQLNGPDPVPETFNQSVTADFNETATARMTPTVPTTNNFSSVSSPRILCAVYTYEGKHHQLKAIVETWGWRCDGFFAASTKTDPDLGAVDLPHLGEEVYENMWQKTRSILAFMFDNYIDEYDYFHVAGDDAYLIVENLQNYLRLLEVMEGGRDTRPLYVGIPAYFAREGEPIFNLGGPGYILNRLALRRLVMEALPTCRSEETFFAEDLNVGRCLFEMDIFPVDTADAAHRQRFFNFPPHEIVWINDQFLTTDAGVGWKPVFDLWAKDHGWRVGFDLVSTQTVAFHQFKSPVSMKRHHAIIYNSCPINTTLGNVQEL
jgi:glycoprotein-N-acetylgalactosamine 3-beta-galactosyltransferase